MVYQLPVRRRVAACSRTQFSSSIIHVVRDSSLLNSVLNHHHAAMAEYAVIAEVAIFPLFEGLMIIYIIDGTDTSTASQIILVNSADSDHGLSSIIYQFK